MLYKKNKDKELNEMLFQNPTSEYRAAPFWAWNGKLDKKELLWQIDKFEEMGFGGFFMHSRSGLNTEYLGVEFMECVKACNEHAKKKGMFSYLYDEDRYPSGSAGGKVTENPEFRQRYILLSLDEPTTFYAKVKEVQKPYLLACFDVQFDQYDYLCAYKRIEKEDKAIGEKWYAYVLLDDLWGWFNGFNYLDTLNEKAVERFIEITHQAYQKIVGSEFGESVPAIFTDEPNYGHMVRKSYARDGRDAQIFWNEELPIDFKKNYGYEIENHLPELVWTYANGNPAIHKYHFYQYATYRFSRSFCKTIGDWCKNNNIIFTGHLLDEKTLGSQTLCIGDAMQHYKYFGLPGIDMLCNDVEYTTAKQAQSVVHQYGKEGVTSELYGVTGWDFDFRGHKWQGDWQAALGVTLRVPHLSWYTMKGSAKRDYPASIHYHSSWYKQYSYIEDHFARLNTVLTRGKPLVNIGVIHPIESYWLIEGDWEHSSKMMEEQENSFSQITEILLNNNLDFDYINEALLPELYEETEQGFKQGEMCYQAVVIPPMKTIRKTTLNALENFMRKGGKVIIVGAIPKLVDGKISALAKRVFVKARHIDFSSQQLVDILNEEKNIDICNENGSKNKDYLYNYRQDGENKWLFLAKAEQPIEFDGGIYQEKSIVLHIKGEFKPILYDTVEGTHKEIEFELNNGETIVRLQLYAYDSVLLKLENNQEKIQQEKRKQRQIKSEKRFSEKYKYRLNEPNVLVLDIGEYSLNKKEWLEREEVLRIDSKLRKEYHYPLANGWDVQPWKIQEEKPEKFVYLRFVFESEGSFPCHLAVEETEEIIFNGKKIAIAYDGWFVDKAIKTIPLPNMQIGKNILIICMPISKRTSLENAFILGDFGVKVEGEYAKIVKKPERIYFGSLVEQGFPFYGGEITYILPFETEEQENLLVVDKYNGALINVKVDEKERGKIVYPPYKLPLKDIKKGTHILELTIYLSRINCFGPIHQCVDTKWHGPETWYFTDEKWAYEYQLKVTGILKSPKIFQIKEKIKDEIFK